MQSEIRVLALQKETPLPEMKRYSSKRTFNRILQLEEGCVKLEEDKAMGKANSTAKRTRSVTQMT